VIVHGDEEQVIGLVSRSVIIHIISPSKPVTVNSSFSIVVVTRENNNSILALEVIGSCSTFQIHKAQVSVVSRILIHTVEIVWLGTVSVVVIGLSIFRPTAHGSVGSARRQSVGISDTALEVGERSRPFNTLPLSHSFVESTDRFGIFFQDTRRGSIFSFIDGFNFFLPF
jgi:hypothetical protein